MTSYLLLFLAFSLAKSDHVVSGPWVPGVWVPEMWVPRAFDANSCLKTHLENQLQFSLYVICKYKLVTTFCQPKNLVGTEKWYISPQNQSDSKSFLWWSSSFIPTFITIQIINRSYTSAQENSQSTGDFFMRKELQGDTISKRWTAVTSSKKCQNTGESGQCY